MRKVTKEEVLHYLAKNQGKWNMFFEIEHELGIEPRSGCGPNKRHAVTLRKLYKSGMIGGCICGCRGDFDITDKGLEFIGIERYAEYHGY